MFRIIRKTALFLCLAGLAALAAPAAAQDEFPATPPTGAKLLTEGQKFPEGPAMDRKGNLYFSTVYSSQIMLWDGKTAKEFAKATGGVNGLAIHKDGTLYGCAGGEKAIVKFKEDGAKSVVLDKLDGQPLNGVNDLVFDAKGNLYFTNPIGMSAPKADGPKPSVVRLGADGKAAVVATDPAYPNGIDLSPDGKTLYVTDAMGDSSVWSYPIDAKGAVGKGKVLHKFGKGVCDGMAVAESGNLYVVLHLGAKVVKLSPEGKVLKEYKFPKGSGVTNVCFGGKDMKTLYITLGGKGQVYSLAADEPGLKLYSHK